MKVPYTVILLEEAPEGPDFFTEVARVAELDATEATAIKTAHDLFDRRDPRVRVIGILKGNFAGNWIPGSRVKEDALHEDGHPCESA